MAAAPRGAPEEIGARPPERTTHNGRELPSRLGPEIQNCVEEGESLSSMCNGRLPVKRVRDTLKAQQEALAEAS